MIENETERALRLNEKREIVVEPEMKTERERQRKIQRLRGVERERVSEILKG